jgi:hypothetical protein
MTKAEIKQKFEWIDELFDRVARRHKGFGQDVADLKRRVAKLELRIDVLEDHVTELQSVVLAQPASPPPENPPFVPHGVSALSGEVVTVAPTAEAMPLPAEFPVIAGGRLVIGTGTPPGVAQNEKGWDVT